MCCNNKKLFCLVQILDFKHTEIGIILQLISIWFVLMSMAWCQPIYFLMPTQVARSFDLAEDSFYQEPEIEGIQFIEDPAKLFKPNDFFREVNKFVIGVQEFVQNPSSSLYSAFNQLQSNAKKNHQKNQKPVKNKVVLDPFGNISFTLGWSANLGVFNSISFTKSRSLLNHSGWTKG
ncbi:uncharacterized protein LOC6605903 [Drosophila sechellia]|nr:uncharacterized protein LOC6605903 [Drosophila sechellia]